MSTIEEAAAALSNQYKAAGYIMSKILYIKAGVDSDAPAILAEANRRWGVNESNAAALFPECGLGVGHDGHRVVLRKIEQPIGDSGPIG